MEKTIYDLDLYPEKPGVYLMKNEKGIVIYIGKAKNLKNRLRQYFSQQDSRAMIPYLLAHMSQIETIICFSEKEALILENTLIKKHKPKYNALLKDDKSFICLYIDPKSTWPKLDLVRTKDQGKHKGVYFGPYSQAHAAREAYKVLSEHFGLRQCSDYELDRRQRPCLLYGMKKCLAPCKNLCSSIEYHNAVRRVIKFLQGDAKDLLNIFKDKIAEASEELAFEKAAALYKTLKQLETIAFSRQAMVQINHNDMDIFNLYQEGARGVLAKLIYREGKVTGQEIMHFDQTLDEGGQLLSRILLQHYERHTPAPNLLCPIEPDESSVLAEVLKDLTGIKVAFQIPQKGDKKALVDLAYENAKLHFEQSHDELALLLELEEVAQLSRFPETIECFDLSHFSGSEPCAVKIRFEQGKLLKAGKRLFKIKEAKGGDDYGGMKEALTRSLKTSKLEDTLPDLILVDGGKGQVSMATEVLRDLDIACCDIIGIAKENSRHDKGLNLEKLILPHLADPVILDRKSPLLFFLQKIRDETHRAVISFNQKREKAKLITSKLDSIPGIGPVKKKALLLHFGSVQKIKEASLEKLMEVGQITLKDAKCILNFFLTLK